MAPTSKTAVQVAASTHGAGDLTRLFTRGFVEFCQAVEARLRADATTLPEELSVEVALSWLGDTLLHQPCDAPARALRNTGLARDQLRLALRPLFDAAATELSARPLNPPPPALDSADLARQATRASRHAPAKALPVRTRLTALLARQSAAPEDVLQAVAEIWSLDCLVVAQLGPEGSFSLPAYWARPGEPLPTASGTSLRDTPLSSRALRTGRTQLLVEPRKIRDSAHLRMRRIAGMPTSGAIVPLGDLDGEPALLYLFGYRHRELNGLSGAVEAQTRLLLQAAIKGALLQRLAARRARPMAAAGEILATLGYGLPPRDMGAACARVARARLRYPVLEYASIDHVARQCVLHLDVPAGDALSTTEVARPLAETGIIQHVVRSGRPYLTGNAAEDPVCAPALGRDTGSQLAAPVFVEGGVVGVLLAESGTRYAFDQVDLQSLALLAQALGQAMRQAEFQQRHRSEEQLQSAVARVTDVALSGGSYRSVADVTLAEIKRLLGVEKAGIYERLYANGVPRYVAGPELKDTEESAVRREMSNVPLNPGEIVQVVDLSNTMISERARAYFAAAGVRYLMRVILIASNDRLTYAAIGAAHESELNPALRAAAAAFARRVQPALSSATLHEHLHNVRRNLDDREQELYRLSYTLAHDLRSPAASILGLTRMLGGKSAQGPDAADLLQRVQNNARRLLGLIDGLTGLARVGRVPGEPGTIDAHSVLVRVLDDLAPRMQQSRALIETECGPFHVRLHEVHMHQLWHNLIGNALDYARPDTAPHVRVTCREQDQRRVFEVRDNGCGIPEHELANLGRLFHRAGRTDPPGSGLGLAIVKRVIELAGGAIEFESRLGEGTTVRFWLPATTAP